MAPGLILLVGAVYLYIAIDMLAKGNSGMAVVFGGYAFSNIGLWLAAK